MLDDALLNRDAAALREKQAIEDLQKASNAMESLVEEVATRIQDEVEKIKTQYDEQVKAFADEIEVSPFRGHIVKAVIIGIDNFLSGRISIKFTSLNVFAYNFFKSIKMNGCFSANFSKYIQFYFRFWKLNQLIYARKLRELNVSRSQQKKN